MNFVNITIEIVPNLTSIFIQTPIPASFMFVSIHGTLSSVLKFSRFFGKMEDWKTLLKETPFRPYCLKVWNLQNLKDAMLGILDDAAAGRKISCE